jgi:hypothetical protein
VLASECYVTYLPFVSNPHPHPPSKKKNRQNKTYKLKVVLKGASKPILPDDTHNEPKMSFSFFQVPHTPQQQQQSNVEDCHRLTEMFSLNFPFRNIFCFLV